LGPQLKSGDTVADDDALGEELIVEELVRLCEVDELDELV
jgi:hypothetical protein